MRFDGEILWYGDRVRLLSRRPSRISFEGYNIGDRRSILMIVFRQHIHQLFFSSPMMTVCEFKLGIVNKEDAESSRRGARSLFVVFIVTCCKAVVESEPIR